MKTQTEWLRNKSNYLVGFGLGTGLTAALLVPGNGRFPSENKALIAVGLVFMLLGGTFTIIARKREQNGSKSK